VEETLKSYLACPSGSDWAQLY